MQPQLCSRCKKNVAVVFITRMENGKNINEGLCLKCAKNLGLPQVNEMMQRMGITDEDLDNLNNEMMQALDSIENVEDLRMSNEMIAQFDRLHCGLDFGFAVDPLAFVQMHYDAKKEELYIFDEVYQQKLTNRAVAQILRAKHLTAPIIADSAEPKSIAEIRDMGFNIIGCRKGPDSVA